MPRTPRKMVIEELLGQRYRVTPVTQSSSRRPREFDNSMVAMEYIWQVLTITEESIMLEFQPLIGASADT
jgi:hypothetical protein